MKTTTFLCIIFLLVANQSFARKNIGFQQSALPITLANCPNTSAQTDLSINNVRARILNGGDLWWNYNDNSTGIYEVPNGSGKVSIYAGAIWVGGFDVANNLKMAN